MDRRAVGAFLLGMMTSALQGEPAQAMPQPPADYWPCYDLYLRKLEEANAAVMACIEQMAEPFVEMEDA